MISICLSVLVISMDLSVLVISMGLSVLVISICLSINLFVYQVLLISIVRSGDISLLSVLLI